MLIGELFDNPNHRLVKSISSSGKTMLIVFKNTYVLETFTGSIKYKKINPDCHSWIDNNMLMSPNYPNINCSWLITGKVGSYIKLDFIFIEVKTINNVAKMH